MKESNINQENVALRGEQSAPSSGQAAQRSEQSALEHEQALLNAREDLRYLAQRGFGPAEVLKNTTELVELEEIEALLEYGTDALDVAASGKVELTNEAADDRVDPDDVLAKIPTKRLTVCADLLLEHGVSEDKLLERLDANQKMLLLGVFDKYGIKIDVHDLLRSKEVTSEAVAASLQALFDRGIYTFLVTTKLSSSDKLANFEMLVNQAGAECKNAKAELVHLLLDVPVEEMLKYLDLMIKYEVVMDFPRDARRLYYYQAAAKQCDLDCDLEKLKKIGMDLDLLAQVAPRRQLLIHRAAFMAQGVNIDKYLKEILKQLEAEEKVTYLSTLIEMGADIDLIVKDLPLPLIYQHLEYLMPMGAKIDWQKLTTPIALTMLDDYCDKRANLPDKQIFRLHLSRLIENGVKIETIVDAMSPRMQAENLDFLVQNGAKIDAKVLVRLLPGGTVAKCLPQLLRNGAWPPLLLEYLTPDELIADGHIALLLEAGVSVKRLVDRLPIEYLARVAGDFKMVAGADITKLAMLVFEVRPVDVQAIPARKGQIPPGMSFVRIAKEMRERDTSRLLDHFLLQGADINRIIKKLPQEVVENNLKALLRAKTDLRLLLRKISPEVKEQNWILITSFVAGQHDTNSVGD